MKHSLISATLVAGGIAFGTGADAAVTFSTFVSGSDIFNTLQNQSTIAFNYTGAGFVGSVYFGPNNNQLYSTNLTGGNVQKYGQPIPGFSSEVVVGVGLGQAGFAKGAVYAGNGAGNQIYYVPSGGAPVLFGTTPVNSEVIRQIFFDPGASFSGKMLVTTNYGNIYSFNSSGQSSLIANVGEDTEGMDIAGSSFGQYAGQLLVASENSGLIRAVSAGGAVTVLQTGTGNVYIPLAETVSYVPLDLGLSGNPIEGFYVANYAYDVQKADASAFSGLQGHAIVTSEYGSNSPVWDLSYNGDGLDTFNVSIVGYLPNQSEDGIFVTRQREDLVGPPVPELSTWAMMGLGFAGLAYAGLRARRKVAARQA